MAKKTKKAPTLEDFTLVPPITVSLHTGPPKYTVSFTEPGPRDEPPFTHTLSGDLCARQSCLETMPHFHDGASLKFGPAAEEARLMDALREVAGNVRGYSIEDTTVITDEAMTFPVRVDVLHEAADIIGDKGDRNASYGSPTQNFTNTADMWTAQLRHILKDGEVITASQVAQLMVSLKLARLIASPKRDNWVDIAGYAGCGAEVDAQQ